MDSFYDVIVCGAGPAGLSAALASCQSGRNTLLAEKQMQPGVKLLASGGGRCNFSNTCDPETFMTAFGRNGRFMSPALSVGSREWLIDFLAEHGVRAVLKDDLYYFPESGKASDILQAFLNTALASGLTFRTNCCVEALELEQSAVSAVILNGERIRCNKLILAAGGTAMPSLGSSDAGLKLAEQTGHRIIQPLPAMAPLYCREDWVKRLSGVSLPDVELSFIDGRNPVRSRGTLLFTYDGISGMQPINLSAAFADAFVRKKVDRITLKFQQEAGFSTWQERLERGRVDSPKKYLRSFLGESGFTHSLANEICGQCGMSEIRMEAMSRERKEILAKYLAGAPLTVAALCPMKKAMAMRGGVSLKDVCPDTLESRLVKGLYFAGEILDLVGPCGGYNIQFAFASGRLAGLS